MSAINAFLNDNNLTIAANPCVSPDFCLNWEPLKATLLAGGPAKSWPSLTFHEPSRFAVAACQVVLVEDPSTGDHAWFFDGGQPEGIEDIEHLGGQRYAAPATWANLLTLKNRILEYAPSSSIFPTASGSLEKSSIGVGARFTTLHWPAVEWAMAQMQVSLTANQNSIPRELVWNLDEMLDDSLATCPFPFIGTSVPEGHQGQSIEGMSHGSVLSKLKTGFHKHGIAWGFNADHQPIGGVFEPRADGLAKGCLLATYITFDLSPELTQTLVPEEDIDVADWVDANVDAALLDTVKGRVTDAGITVDMKEFRRLIAAVYPAVVKMKEMDARYKAVRAEAFTTEIGQKYFRELSIDELPGLTTPATLATMLALVEAMDMPVQYVAPAFGFQKNFPFDDNAELEKRVAAAWKVCDTFGVSIGFHSGSGKSAENYELVGRICSQNLEIKTSGRYTYEMGVALHRSSDPADQALWKDWYTFTKTLALASAQAEDPTEQRMAREFIAHALNHEGLDGEALVADPAKAAEALDGLTPSPDHMFWFEYNFLFVLAAEGKADKKALGDHSPVGYRQRERFYAISDIGRLEYAKNVAGYLVFLCRTTGLASSEVCDAADAKLGGYSDYAGFLADISG